MKVLLTTLNSKYIHSSLALRYLEKYCNKYKEGSSYRIEVREFSINEPLDQIMAEIYRIKADLIAFSTYIWNIDLSFQLISRLKKVLPEVIFVAGGPEVSYDPINLLGKTPALDIIVKGEGEETFKELLARLEVKGDQGLKNIAGIVYRDSQGEIKENQERELLRDLDRIPFPYTKNELAELKNKILYYESSRGCPFNCSYCLSSTTKGVRAFSLERVKEDLLFFIENNICQVKFVDRTFNYDRRRTWELFKFLIENRGNTSFHFEITGDLLDEDLLELLKSAPVGLFQFEIGVQSTNTKTLDSIDRRTNFDTLAKNVRFLRENTGIKLYLDLIAGLPEEDYSSFQRSFDQVYNLNPQVLQLGFLKLLKGSKVRNEAKLYYYKYTKEPPYEVLENQDISFGELLKLKNIEFVVDKYHNSGVFYNTLKYIFRKYFQSYFSFYEKLAEYFLVENLYRKSHSRRSLYNILFNFCQKNLALEGEDLDKFTSFLKYDLLLQDSGVKLPDWAVSDNVLEYFTDLRYRFLADEENLKLFLPHLAGKRVKEILKVVRFELFNYDPTVDFPWRLNRYNLEQDNLRQSNLEEDKLAEYRLKQSEGKPKEEKPAQVQVSMERRTYVILFDYSDRNNTLAWNVTDYILG